MSLHKLLLKNLAKIFQKKLEILVFRNNISDSLDMVRQSLFEMKAVRKFHHPKVLALCKEIETWLKKKKAKSKDDEIKVKHWSQIYT